MEIEDESSEKRFKVTNPLLTIKLGGFLHISLRRLRECSLCFISLSWHLLIAFNHICNEYPNAPRGFGLRNSRIIIVLNLNFSRLNNGFEFEFCLCVLIVMDS